MPIPRPADLLDQTVIRRVLPHGWEPMRYGVMYEEQGRLWVVTEASGPKLPTADDRMLWGLRSGDLVEQFTALHVGDAAGE